jgi:hypothetical protein
MCPLPQEAAQWTSACRNENRRSKQKDRHNQRQLSLHTHQLARIGLDSLKNIRRMPSHGARDCVVRVSWEHFPLESR